MSESHSNKIGNSKDDLNDKTSTGLKSSSKPQIASLKSTTKPQLEPEKSISTKFQRARVVESYASGIIDTSRRDPRLRARYFVVSGPWILFTFTAICTDLFIVFTLPDDDPFCFSCHPLRSSITCIVVLVYWIDIALRIYAFRAKVFFWKMWNLADFVVVLITTFATMAEYLHVEVFGLSSLRFLKIVRVVRIVLLLRILRLAGRTSTAICDCMRHVTGENKGRFVDLVHDFDLDLVYVTPQLIAMGVPAAGCVTSLYRNPLKEVVRFFERFHPCAYYVVNLCPELPYPDDAFKTGFVKHFDVQDHTPPLLEDFLSFLNFAQAWLSKSSLSVLAVHCKGGKGRTGSMCCAWLLYAKEAEDARDALNFFLLQRTDMEKRGFRQQHHLRKRKVQGVETPSQVRYVEYIHNLLVAQSSYFPLMVNPTPRVRISLQKLVAHEFFWNPPVNLVVAVHDVAAKRVVFWSAVSSSDWDLGQIEIHGDVRISVFDAHGLPLDLPVDDMARARQAQLDDIENSGKRIISGEEPGCVFYFIFHTSFLEDNELHIPMSSMDKAWKKSNLYREDGSLVLSFSKVWSAEVADME